MRSLVYSKYVATENETTVPDMSEYFDDIIKSNKDIKDRLRIERNKKNKEVLEQYRITPKKKKSTPDSSGNSTLQY